MKRHEIGVMLVNSSIAPGRKKHSIPNTIMTRRHTQDRAEVARMMRTPIAGEITEREPHNGYLVMQGGLPEIEEWIRSHWK